MDLLNGDLSRNELVSWCLLIAAFWSLSFTWFFLALIATAYLAWFIRQQFFAVQWIRPTGKVVYITGCDSGFGKEAALQLANAGFVVCAGCLRPDQCQDLTVSPNIHVLDLDVSDDSKIRDCAEYVEKICGQRGLWALYNNAGFAAAGEIEWMPQELYERQMNVNLWGSVRVTRSVLPLIRQAKGRVVTVTSGIARAAAPGRSPYCMSKAALESFMECLRYEMEKFGVKCSVIQPGNLSGTTQVFAGMRDQVSRMYDQLPKKIRDAYGEEYLKKFFAVTVENYSARGGPTTAPIEPVINDIKHAIMSEHPRIRYKPAQLGWLLWWFFYNVLPEELTHFYITKWQLKNFPKPPSAGRQSSD